MRLMRVEGPAIVCHCDGCAREAIAGTIPYISAASGEPRAPEEWYQSEDGGLYCSACAAKLVQVDPTRSVNQFFTDTAGTQIDPDVLA